MSLRQGAPYEDAIQDGGTTIIYEGHDVPRSAHIQDPKIIDQSERSFSGNLTENGKFHAAAQEYKSGLRPPERVRVFEKIKAVDNYLRPQHCSLAARTILQG